MALLHSYHNPAHEEAVKSRLLGLGFSHVSTSADLAPLIKLLPRAETCVANAYLQPVMQSFLDHIAGRMGDEGQLLTMTSAGGLEPITTYCPKDSLLSGPAGGVSGAAAIAESLGFQRILTFDMGGTTAKICLIDDGEPQQSRTFEVARQYRFLKGSGLPLRIPVIEMVEIGAGGGST